MSRKPIESPCILVCALDRSATYCLGCGRHRQEIAEWVRLSDEERRAIMAELPDRLAEIQAREASA